VPSVLYRNEGNFASFIEPSIVTTRVIEKMEISESTEIFRSNSELAKSYEVAVLVPSGEQRMADEHTPAPLPHEVSVVRGDSELPASALDSQIPVTDERRHEVTDAIILGTPSTVSVTVPTDLHESSTIMVDVKNQKKPIDFQPVELVISLPQAPAKQDLQPDHASGTQFLSKCK